MLYEKYWYYGKVIATEDDHDQQPEDHTNFNVDVIASQSASPGIESSIITEESPFITEPNADDVRTYSSASDASDYEPLSKIRDK